MDREEMERILREMGLTPEDIERMKEEVKAAANDDAMSIENLERIYGSPQNMEGAIKVMMLMIPTIRELLHTLGEKIPDDVTTFSVLLGTYTALAMAFRGLKIPFKELEAIPGKSFEILKDYEGAMRKAGYDPGDIAKGMKEKKEREEDPFGGAFDGLWN